MQLEYWHIMDNCNWLWVFIFLYNFLIFCQYCPQTWIIWTLKFSVLFKSIASPDTAFQSVVHQIFTYFKIKGNAIYLLHFMLTTKYCSYLISLSLLKGSLGRINLLHCLLRYFNRIYDTELTNDLLPLWANSQNYPTSWAQQKDNWYLFILNYIYLL